MHNKTGDHKPHCAIRTTRDGWDANCTCSDPNSQAWEALRADGGLPESQPMTDPLKLDQREALARAATPGPWRRGQSGNLRVYGPDDSQHSGLLAEVFSPENAAHIAENDPMTVLATIEEVKRLRQERTWQPIAEHDGNTEHSVIGWEPGLDEPVEMARIDRDWYTRGGVRMYPTHWMPLPAPPEAP